MECPEQDPVSALARERFGIAWLQPWQRLVIASILDASLNETHFDTNEAARLRQVALLPTGFGKSLCFQLPALLLPRPTLIVYPLLALMADQKRRLDSLGIASVLFRGGMTEAERALAEDSVLSGRAKLIITNPECLARGRLRGFIEKVKPSHFVIDEAHCVTEWGESFRPDYLALGEVLGSLNPPVASAFTATAGPRVRERMTAVLFGGSAWSLVEGDADRPNIYWGVTRTLSRERSLVRLAGVLPRPMIVFCSSREGTEMVSRLLRRRHQGRHIRFYHAGLSVEEKQRIETWFLGSPDAILVSTCAYGMGVDKRDIRTVLHYDIPPSIEAYLQESGRAGRDGKPAFAQLISAPDDGSRLRHIVDPSRQNRFMHLLSYAARESGCRREALLEQLGAARDDRACSGCDRCNGSASNIPEGARELFDFTKANPRRFDEREAVAILGGAPHSGEIRCAGWGRMREWDAGEIVSAIRSSLELGYIRRHGWPWKGRLAKGDPDAQRSPWQTVNSQSKRNPFVWAEDRLPALAGGGAASICGK